LAVENVEELAGRDDANRLVRIERQELLVAGDQIFGIATHRSGQNKVVLRVGRDAADPSSYGYNLCKRSESVQVVANDLGRDSLTPILRLPGTRNFFENML